jgi:glycosyltransferase involved in cell wall biosynthesis
MMGKVDLVMWTKNGGKFLRQVFEQIERVIPEENINQRIVVDDHSKDETIRIAKDFNWQVYPNPAHGIASGANEALRHVQTEYFVSLEQDVILAEEWWEKIPMHMANQDVAVAQGIRLATHPTLKILDEYEYSRKGALFGASLDNNLIRTKIIRQLGGFPTKCSICVVYHLLDVIVRANYRWIIDKTVVSQHLRTDLKSYYRHAYLQYANCECHKSDLKVNMRLFLTSPLRSMHLAIAQKHPQLLYVYPRIRFNCLQGALNARNRSIQSIQSDR